MSRETYSYDVPDVCLDFKDMNDETINIDAWFDEKENGNQEMELANEGPPNVVHSMTECHPTRQENPSPPGRVAKKLSARQKSAQRRIMAKNHAKKVAIALASKQEPPPVKKQKMSNHRENLGEIDLNQNVSPENAQDPLTPDVHKTRGPSTKGKSTEELELEKMQQLQQEVAELRRKNEESLKVAIAGPGQPTKTSSHITKPMDFHFYTDERHKQHGESQRAVEYKEVDFIGALRKHPPSPSRLSKGPTIPKPFNLSSGKKRKLDEAPANYVPLAQQVENFQKCTSERYHLRNRKEEEGSSKPLKPRLTNPKTPRLETKSRLRPTTCKSAAELEEEEIAKLQQYRFKAQELNHRILEGGPLLPKKPQMKELTKPIGFNLEIEKRIQEREAKKVQEEEHFEFHSRPCPTRILEDVVGVPEKKQIPITVPQSPAFALKNKVGALAREEQKEKVEEVAHVIKAKPMPHPGVPFKPKVTEPRLVECCPFSFEARDKERLLQKEKKMEELQKEEVPKFKAHPLPQFDHIHLPEKKVKSATKPEPFQLAIDARGAVRQEMWQQQLKEEMRRQKEAATFKAHSSQVLQLEPFVPKKDSKLALVSDHFELATERRARERQEFERRLAELEAEKARLQEAARRVEEERAKEEMAKLREDLVHKANPIRKYSSVEVKPSDHPLTVPRSPNFSDRFNR
ncbi:targeting protein for Xklp2 isoform X2 [Ahaetulla prasina]|uniref:targeting protein for Xklp2 isoform X2 n=1 Tax=Ahaetulla prasina TaxID=499056 RepID=UPI002647F681|nr:targeting protein for Xklp2 isoform X2 [Ahaetulla prasina]